MSKKDAVAKDILNFDKASASDRKFFLKVGEVIFTQASLQLLRDRHITGEGKTDEELKEELLAQVREQFRPGKSSFTLTIDYADRLLSDARKFSRQQELELSALYFATYFEHRLNWLIAQLCERNRIQDSTTRQILRDTNIRAKCSWLIELLGEKSIRPNITKVISNVSEIRNSFVHYKWSKSTFADKQTELTKEKLISSLKKVESAVKHLRKLEETGLYSGHGKRIRRISRAHAKGLK
jgi:hypothetical protein